MIRKPKANRLSRRKVRWKSQRQKINRRRRSRSTMEGETVTSSPTVV